MMGTGIVNESIIGIILINDSRTIHSMIISIGIEEMGWVVGFGGFALMFFHRGWIGNSCHSGFLGGSSCTGLGGWEIWEGW